MKIINHYPIPEDLTALSLLRYLNLSLHCCLFKFITTIEHFNLSFLTILASFIPMYIDILSFPFSL